MITYLIQRGGCVNVCACIWIPVSKSMSQHESNGHFEKSALRLISRIFNYSGNVRYSSRRSLSVVVCTWTFWTATKDTQCNRAKFFQNVHIQFNATPEAPRHKNGQQSVCIWNGDAHTREIILIECGRWVSASPREYIALPMANSPITLA